MAAGLCRAIVGGVGDSVSIGVFFGAAIVVRDVVEVFGLAGAFVVCVHDAVAVSVSRFGRRLRKRCGFLAARRWRGWGRHVD